MSNAEIDRREHVVVLETVQRMEHKLDSVSSELRAHVAEETSDIAKEIAKLMREAFPEGDPDGHRRHHELAIEREEERRDFYKSLRKELAKWGLIGVASWLVMLVWRAILLGPKS